MTTTISLDATTYVPHAVHRPGADYPETNCWTDIVIELLHSRGREPLAVLGCTFALQHEGDSLLFFKPRPGDLLDLLGVDIHELQSYRPLRRHLQTQLRAGRAAIVEVDGHWLPDTAGTSYRATHIKTAIAAVALDDQQLTYFHNAGLYRLGGEDLARILDGAGLPGYLEVVRFDAPGRQGEDLRLAAVDVLRRILDGAPRNPFVGLTEQFADELDEVLALDAAGVHDFAFATTRMAGAAAALAGAHVRWLLSEAGEPAADRLDAVSAAARALTFRLMRRRPFDPGPLLASLADDWDDALGRLRAVLG